MEGTIFYKNKKESDAVASPFSQKAGDKAY